MNEGVDHTRLVRRCAPLLILGATGLSSRSQPVCSIDLGPDITFAGNPVQLNGPAGFSNYLWNTGATSASIIANTPGSYTCQVSYATGNLVANGNFSSGNSGFSTQFVYNPNLNLGDGYYYIGTNAASYHSQFSGTGSGQFMIVNSGWNSAWFMVRCQDITVCPGQTYTLSYRARTVSNSTPARLQWWMNGSGNGPEVVLPAFGAGWQTITHIWTAPLGPTTATICLRAMSGDGVGNDFGLDDISISSTVILSDQVEILVDALPVELVSFTGEAIMGKTNLDWRTASERNNDHFRLLRSGDLDSWEEIARIAGAGNSQTERDYHAVDGTPRSGTNYYALEQVDLDGTETRYPLVAVTHMASELGLVGPNPAPVGMPIRFNAFIDGCQVTDLLGRYIPYTVSGNSLSILAGAGVYLVTMQRGEISRSVRVILE